MTMPRSFNLALAAVPFAALALGGCSSPSTGSSASNQDLSADSTAGAPIGHYVLGSDGFGNNDSWINEINLHENGTFDGNFGSALSDLSGHSFLANGTYKVSQTTEGPAIFFTYPFPNVGSETAEYLYKPGARDGELQFEAVDKDLESIAWFALDSAPAPTTVLFDANFDAPSVTELAAGTTVLIRYDAAREKCTGDQSGLSLLYIVDGGGEQVLQFPPAVDGFFDVLVTIPAGQNLGMWFQNSSGASCNHIDSNFSANYNFSID